jgi:pimeloyl-ACP methyl ester carboxylesterase
MDQVLHGPRNHSCWPPTSDYENCVGTAYFNFINPYAGRDNTRQGAADGFQLLRLAHALPALDATRIVFLGHSQGGLTGAPFVAAEPELKAGAMSGTGGILAITVLVRKDPLDFKALAELLLGIDGKESLEPFHPALMVIQTFGEPADPISYGPLFATGKSVLLTEGLLDPYTSAQASEALGAASRFDIGGTAAHENDAFVSLGLHVDPLPHDLPAGSGLLLQFPDDGHFAMFDNPVARCRVEGFLQTALAGDARVDACGGD